MCWIVLSSCFVTAGRCLFHCKITLFDLVVGYTMCLLFLDLSCFLRYIVFVVCYMSVFCLSVSRACLLCSCLSSYGPSCLIQINKWMNKWMNEWMKKVRHESVYFGVNIRPSKCLLTKYTFTSIFSQLKCFIVWANWLLCRYIGCRRSLVTKYLSVWQCCWLSSFCCLSYPTLFHHPPTMSLSLVINLTTLACTHCMQKPERSDGPKSGNFGCNRYSLGKMGQKKTNFLFLPKIQRQRRI